AQADVHKDRLENNGRDLSGIFAEPAFHRGQIVEGRNQNIGDGGFRYTQATRNRRGVVHIAEIGSVWLHAYQRGIVQPVIRAFELYDLVTPGGCASKPNSVHSGFGSR